MEFNSLGSHRPPKEFGEERKTQALWPWLKHWTRFRACIACNSFCKTNTHEGSVTGVYPWAHFIWIDRKINEWKATKQSKKVGQRSEKKKKKRKITLTMFHFVPKQFHQSDYNDLWTTSPESFAPRKKKVLNQDGLCLRLRLDHWNMEHWNKQRRLWLSVQCLLFLSPLSLFSRDDVNSNKKWNERSKKG